MSSDLSSPWEVLGDRADGPGLALAYGSFFWPELVEIDGFILIKENFDRNYLARTIAASGREKVEQTINTTYLQDVFGAGSIEDRQDWWSALGELTRVCWAARAGSLFPDREFAATFQWYSDGADPGVTLYQTGF